MIRVNLDSFPHSRVPHIAYFAMCGFGRYRNTLSPQLLPQGDTLSMDDWKSYLKP